jgi:hypothetical protein
LRIAKGAGAGAGAGADIYITAIHKIDDGSVFIFDCIDTSRDPRLPAVSRVQVLNQSPVRLNYVLVLRSRKYDAFVAGKASRFH